MSSVVGLGFLVVVIVWLIGRRSGRMISDENHAAGSAAEQDLQPTRVRTSLWVIALAGGAVGLVMRLYGFDRSLWLDEFGTLWTIEGDLVLLIRRVFEFQGQSPLYYVLVRLFVHGFGESEVVMRLPSLICGVGTAYLVYKLGERLGGRELGLLAAVLVWLSFPMVEASANARPYSLAAFMAALLLLGFVKAAIDGERRGRVLFVVGGAGLFSAHYVLAQLAVWIGVSYLLFPALRRKYKWSQVAADAGIQLLLVLPWWSHFRSLWGRRGALDWLGTPDYLASFEFLGPLIVVALAGCVGARSEGRTTKPREAAGRAMEMTFWLAVVGQVVLLSVLALAGTNLLARRYLIVTILPAAVLGAIGLLRLAGRLALLPGLYWLVVSGFFFGAHFAVSGSFSRAGHQDWRRAVGRLDELLQQEPRAPVLYRPGFVEDEGWIDGAASSVSFAPLRSPGLQPPSWEVTPLTYRWGGAPGRAEYFQRVVRPAIESSSRFFLLTCRNCYSETTGDYPSGVINWVRQQFPGRFTVQHLQAGRGMLLVFFSAESAAGMVPAPESLADQD